jgi:hypothetical protein
MRHLSANDTAGTRLRGAPGRAAPGTVLGLTGAVSLILLATLTPNSSPPEELSKWCVVCGERGGIDIVQNLLLFMPLGVALRLLGRRMRTVAGIAALLSVMVELLQWQVVPGRYPSLGDVLMNTAGAAVGAAMTPLLAAAVAPQAGQATVLSIAGMAGWVMVVALTTWLLAPSVPAGELHGQWAPAMRGRPMFRGRIIRVEVNGEPVPRARPILRISEFHQAVTASTSRLLVEVVPGGPTAGRAVIARAWRPGATAFVVAQDDRAVVCSRMVLADRWRLLAPEVVLPNALPPEAPDDAAAPWQLECNVESGSLVARRRHGADVAERVLPLTPGLGWIVLLPYSARVVAYHRLVSVLWLAVLSIPVGYWIASHASGRRDRMLALAVVAAGATGVTLGAAPRLAGVSLAPPLEYVAAASGLLIGASLGLARRRRGGPRSGGPGRPR